MFLVLRHFSPSQGDNSQSVLFRVKPAIKIPGGDSHMKGVGMLVVSLRGVNLGIFVIRYDAF